MKMLRNLPLGTVLSCLTLAVALAAPVAAEEKGKEVKPAAQEQKKEETKPAEGAAKAAEKKEKPAVAAKVNGIAISREDVERAAKAFLAQSRVPQPAAPEIMEKAEEAAINQLIAVELLYGEGKKLEFKDFDKKLEERLAQAKGRFQNPEDFKKALTESGLSEKELKDLTGKDLIINNYLEQTIASKVKVSEDDVKKFYKENEDKFKKPEQVRASHILVGIEPGASDDDKKKAKEKAEKIRERVAKGEDFAEMAKKESTCPSREQGGDLGSFGRGQMVPPFEEAAFGLKKPGDISGVVETQFGYHVIKLTEKEAGGLVELSEVKPKIEDYLKNTQIQKQVMEKVEELKKKAKIETF